MAVPEVVTGADVFAHVRAEGTYDDSSPAAGTDSAWAVDVAAAINAGACAVMARGDTYDVDIGADAMTELRVAALNAAGDAYRRRNTSFGLTGIDGSTAIARDFLSAARPTIDRWRDVSAGIG